MEGKLIKLGEDKYSLQVDFDPKVIDGYELSLSNCQAIERGYDLGKIIRQEVKGLIVGDTLSYARGVHDGFQKALEILGDKKFTEDDVRKAYNTNHYSQESKDSNWNNFIQSIQKTEWDVTIETEITDVKLNYGATSFEDCHHVAATRVVKLDSEGCLILKRKK